MFAISTARAMLFSLDAGESARDVRTIQAALLVALHSHSRAIVTASVPLPPDGPKFGGAEPSDG